MDSDADDDSIRHRPSSLLEHINAATRTTIIGGGTSTSPYGNYHDDKDEERHQAAGYPPQAQDPFLDAGRAETPSDIMAGAVTEDMARPAHARYSFDGAGEGELALSAGTEIEVLDDRDHACVLPDTSPSSRSYLSFLSLAGGMLEILEQAGKVSFLLPTCIEGVLKSGLFFTSSFSVCDSAALFAAPFSLLILCLLSLIFSVAFVQSFPSTRTIHPVFHGGTMCSDTQNNRCHLCHGSLHDRLRGVPVHWRVALQKMSVMKDKLLVHILVHRKNEGSLTGL